MRPANQVLEIISKHNYYLPPNLEQVPIVFYEQIVSHLGLSESFKNSFISQIGKLKGYSEQDFKKLMCDSWYDFLNKVQINSLCPMSNIQEQKEIHEFILKVLTEPRQYELQYVDELLQVYENYFQSNKGVAQVIQRNRFRMIISKLICSRYILKQQDRVVQQKIKTFLFDIYLRKLDKKEPAQVISTDLFNELDIFPRLFEQLFDSPIDTTGTFYCAIRSIILGLVKELYTQNAVMAIDIVTQFYQLYCQQDRILFERLEQKNPLSQGLVNEFHHKYREKEDLREAIKHVHTKMTQTTDYKKLLKDLINKDIYSKDNEQLFCPFFREVDQQYFLIRSRKQQSNVENEIVAQIKSLGFQKNEKKGDFIEFDNNKNYVLMYYELLKDFVLIRKDTRQQRKTKELKEVMSWMQSGF